MLLLKDGSLDELVRKRYQSFDSELGAQIEVISRITHFMGGVVFCCQRFGLLICDIYYFRLERLILIC